MSQETSHIKIQQPLPYPCTICKDGIMQLVAVGTGDNPRWCPKCGSLKFGESQAQIPEYYINKNPEIS